MPNNREWALVLWLAVLLVWALTSPKARSSIRDLAKAAASLKIIVPVLGLVAWVAVLITVGQRVGLWHADFATGTVIWFITAGLVLFGRFDDATKSPNFFRRKALATLEVTVAVEVYSEIFVLALPSEIVFQPFLFLLGGMSVVAAQRQEHRAAKKVVDMLIVSVSVTLLAFVTRVKLALLTSFHVKARELGWFSGPWQMQLAQATSFRAARAVVRQFRLQGSTSLPATGQDGA